MSNLEMIKGRIPKKGEKFIYCASNISEMSIDSFGVNVFKDNQVKSDFLMNKYLLFTYLGYGFAREYYSSKIFNVMMEDGINEELLLNYFSYYKKNVLKNEKLFLEDYKRFLRYPLLISTVEGYNDKRFYKFNKYAREIIEDEQRIDTSIIRTLDEKERIARNNLIKAMNDINKEKEKNLLYRKKD